MRLKGAPNVVRCPAMATLPFCPGIGDPGKSPGPRSKSLGRTPATTYLETPIDGIVIRPTSPPNWGWIGWGFTNCVAIAVWERSSTIPVPHNWYATKDKSNKPAAIMVRPRKSIRRVMRPGDAIVSFAIFATVVALVVVATGH